MNTQQSIFEKFLSWLKNSVALKLLTITILMLLLLIPANMIQSIIHERENLNASVRNEVSSKWANGQEINGPVLSIPLLYNYLNKENEVITQTKYLYLLPEQLMINGEITPKNLKRGMYKVIVYRSKLNVSGKFNLNFKIDYNGLKEIQFDKAFLSIGISDLRGIEDKIEVNWGKEKLAILPGSQLPEMMPSGVSVELPNLENIFKSEVDFSFQLKLQGSQHLSFIPVGGLTEVQLNSSWNSPSFIGSFIPKIREVNENGFSAKWKTLLINRNFPQSWVNQNMTERMKASSFGVNLITPLDDYRKSIRSAKYSALCISLIFLVFFLIEILNKRRIHPFQYIMVGLALCLFYVLLISISEHSNFNLAYLISALICSFLISLYSISIFKSLKFTGILCTTLLGIYTFIFVTLQLTDYALLMGSIGLTIILAITMYATRNIDWYHLDEAKE